MAKVETFRAQARRIIPELFQVVEWFLVISAVEYAGQRINAWSLRAIALFLACMLSIYLSETLVDARAQAEKPGFNGWSLVRIVIFTGAIGAAISKLVGVLVEATPG